MKNNLEVMDYRTIKNVNASNNNNSPQCCISFLFVDHNNILLASIQEILSCSFSHNLQSILELLLGNLFDQLAREPREQFRFLRKTKTTFLHSFAIFHEICLFLNIVRRKKFCFP